MELNQGSFQNVTTGKKNTSELCVLLKALNGDVFVKTRPHSVQFHRHTWGYYKCQRAFSHHSLMIPLMHWHALMGQNFLHISSTHLLQGSEVNQSKICLPEKWLVTTSGIWQYFTVIRLWIEKNLITSINLWSADNWIFIYFGTFTHSSTAFLQYSPRAHMPQNKKNVTAVS